MTPASQLLVLLIRMLILAWQWVLTPVLGANCRYTPSCSHYAAEALSCHGPLRGGWLAVRRIISCNPWGGTGYNPVPSAQDYADTHNQKNEHPRHGWAMPTRRS
ncbi:MAG: membrane protein insertion efficiency factor YidD [Alphaproteobacteria bacterium]|nr:membrane protein insertion efficiency factor YidD [Alphaproteobacteria bacterium]HCP01668.1 membrane protein insertion efficiency factor YidD [Rhodospirillaceae bacterium]